MKNEELKSAEEHLKDVFIIAENVDGMSKETKEKAAKDWIKDVQRNAVKHGMTLAAEIVFPVNLTSNGSEEHKRKLNRDYDRILIALDNLTL